VRGSTLSKRSGIVLWSRVRLFRNLKGQCFVSSDRSCKSVPEQDNLNSRKQRKAVYEKVVCAVDGLSDQRKMKLTSISSLSDPKIIEFYEKGVFSEYLKNVRAEEYRGIITGSAGAVVAMVNERHHLVLQDLRPGFQLDKAWEEADKLDDLFGSQLKYAWNRKFGYLMADSECCGAGLEVTISVHLPGLIILGEMQEIVSAFGAVGLKLDAEISGDVFIDGFGQLMRVSNNLAVPDNEEVVLRKIERAVSGLVTQEEQARLRVLGNAKIKKLLYNKISCSLAVLKNSVIMERAQSYEELSWFRTGVAMGLVKGMTLAQVDKLNRDIWSSNFLSYFRGSFDEAVEHVAVTRAAVLRERLRGVKVTFI